MCSCQGMEALLPVENVVMEAANAIPAVLERIMIEQMKKLTDRRRMNEDTESDIGETNFLTISRYESNVI